MKKYCEINRTDMSSPRYARAVRFSDQIVSLMRDFIPLDRVVHRRILEVMAEFGWENNLEIIQVPPELDELDALQLALHRIETMAKKDIK